MNDQVRLLLDRVGDAFLPDGFQLILSEKEFLLHASDEGKMLIRGESICRWAEAFFRARDIAFDMASSPTKSLRDACPQLSEEQAATLFARIGSRYQKLSQPIKSLDILQELYPDGPWHTIPSRFHAAQWILWLSTNLVSDYILPLLATQAALWRHHCDETEACFYDVLTTEGAEKTLCTWFGLEERDKQAVMGCFPVDVPLEWQQKARDTWAAQILSAGGMLFEEIRALELPKFLYDIAASVALDYYKANPGSLNQKRVNVLSGYLSPNDVQRLQSLCPPADPGDLPITPHEVFAWFTERYLPYRKWQVNFGDDASCRRVHELAATFAQWCLGIYPSALSGAKDYLSIAFASSLQKSRHDCVTLWVVLDGLHYADAETLSQCVETEEPRLTLEMSSVAISPLPTITRFCKKAVLYGQPPAMAEARSLDPDFPGAISLPENKDPAVLLRQAKPGDIFVWRIEEPDKTYHKPHDRKTLLTKVAGQLQYLADRVAQAARAVPETHMLRVVIATDHGRLLAASSRNHAIPNKMETHGRAAYGSSDILFDATGILLKEEEQIAYLSRTRFQLPVDCAIALDNHAFVTNDGKTGTEEFSHGGLYPEEVLVPWMQFARDWKPPDIRSHVTGKAVAGKPGTLVLHFENPGKVPVRAETMSVDFGNHDIRQVALDTVLAAMSPTDTAVTLDNWPTKSQCEQASGTVTLQMPHAKEFHCSATFALESDQMYVSELDASDLLSLGDL